MVENMRGKAVVILFALLLSSCVPQAGRNALKDDQSETTGGTPSATAFSTELNYLQNGTTQSSSIFSINVDFSDTFYLRGKAVDVYIKNKDMVNPRCFVGYFKNSLNNRLMVLSALPKSFYNMSNNSIEYYYLLQPSSETGNKSFCDKLGLNNKLDGIYNDPSHEDYSSTQPATRSYSFQTICADCASSVTLASGKLVVYTEGGTEIESIDLSYITLKLNHQATTENQGGSCTSSAACISLGYQCCSQDKQCANDGQVKAGVDKTSSEYLQAISDKEANPANVVDYPNIFHICGNAIYPTPTPDEIDPEEEATKRLKELGELYRCTTLQHAEMSICSIVHENATSETTDYSTELDDRNFSYTYTGVPAEYAGEITPMPDHGIHEIVHGGEIIFQDRKNKSSPAGFKVKDENDTLTDATKIYELTHTIGASAPDDNLVIHYQIDGSCEKINATMAKCSKHYMQGQNTAKIDDHYPASNLFALPEYADTGKAIKVEVDGDSKQQGTHWSLNTSTGVTSIEFTGSGLQVYDNQQIVLTFYVNTTINPVMKSKQKALDRIDDICECGGNNCTLEPEYSNDVISNYKCVYPDPEEIDPPLSQVVYLGAKSVPHRFFDSAGGVYHKEVTSGITQEGNEFKYESNNLLKPNNLSSDIGFNEIYGSFTDNPNGASPAKEVAIKKGYTYDIYTDTGTFSTCHYCGTDYYSQLKKLFPDNMTAMGAGYEPDATATNRFQISTYRSDDLIFGRACFIPATMIPWTHVARSNRQEQRLNRLKAQHFLFANGYQRDWYGFNYGSVIGSFDGVLWFSIGNQRRIEATSNKLFLAINAPFGDLTVSSSYKITVSDSSLTPLTDETVTSDFESTGASCQQYHECETDRDCAAQLGHNYSCQNIFGIKTSWPVFDGNALETPSQESTQKLASLTNVSRGGQKRCVYRALGAPCEVDYNIQSKEASYCSTLDPGLHACSSNNYCQTFSEDGAPVSKFNNKIGRYGRSLTYQNAYNGTENDTFGLGARLIGRPLEYIGTKSIDNTVSSQLSSNNLKSICISGRNSTNWNATLIQHNSYPPTNGYFGDQMSAIGMSMSGSSAHNAYLNSCSVFDSVGNFYYLDSDNFNKVLNDQTLSSLAGTQTISTNSMQILQSILGISNSIVIDFNAAQITSAIYQEDRCLRAPGSVCSSDFECAPSKFLAEKISSLSADNSAHTAILNKYEINFWKEYLVCGQKYAKDDSNFDLKENRCCREAGKNLTIGTYNGNSDIFDYQNIPGISINLDDRKRYSRFNTVYKDLKDGELKYLKAAYSDQCSSGTCFPMADIENQFKTFTQISERTCCTGHWIRNFHDDNGGGHKWEPSKAQNINKTSFRCLNWYKCEEGVSCGGTSPYFSCAHTSDDPANPKCLAKSTSNAEALKVFDFIDSLELLGIPQVAVKAYDFSEILCLVSPENQSFSPGASDTTSAGAPTIIPNTILTVTNNNVEYQDSAGNYYFSGSDSSNFHDDLKMIFSEDEVTCCIPAGDTVPDGTNPDDCCTGYISSENKCALKNYSNLSVYFNRYVSSASTGVADNLFDPKTGFFSSTVDAPSTALQQLACTLHVCESDTIAQGVALSNLQYPGVTTGELIRRYIDDNSDASNYSGMADYYDDGLRWNSNLYCVPSSLVGTTSPNLFVLDCRGF